MKKAERKRLESEELAYEETEPLNIVWRPSDGESKWVTQEPSASVKDVKAAVHDAINEDYILKRKRTGFRKWVASVWDWLTRARLSYMHLFFIILAIWLLTQ